ncbi:MAG: hypothetical protein KA293_03400 [Bacteroidia bacterium]|nr:hypothetical protein [Bacteroidia bacterium]
MKTGPITKLLLVAGMLSLYWGCRENQPAWTGAPIAALQTFAAKLESSGWVADTARVRKVAGYAGLKTASIRSFDGRPFYRIAFEDSEIPHGEGSAALDQNLFSNAKSIWGYYYRQKDATEWISDGVIEQWEFDNASLASKAMQQLTPVGDEVYFNTTPYFCCLNQYLIIFHTRANAFSYDQAPLFAQFVQEMKAETLTRN